MPVITEVLLSKVAASVEGPGFFCFSVCILILLIIRWVSRRIRQKTKGGWSLRRLEIPRLAHRRSYVAMVVHGLP